MTNKFRLIGLAVLALAAVTARSGPAKIAAQTASPESPGQVNSAVLQPGDSITFVSPYLPRPPPAQGPAPPAVFGRLNLEIDNQSGQPLAVSYDYGADQELIGRANVGLALPDGYALQVLLTRARGNPRGFETACRAVNGKANQATCEVAISAMPGGTDRITITAAPAGDVQSLTLPPGGAAVLIGPEPAGGDERGVPSLGISSGSGQTAAITWDGSTLTIAAPEGYAVSETSVRHPLPNAEGPLPAPDCSPVDGQPSAVECSISASPPVQFSYSTVLRAPSGTFSLPYSDKDGQGTMTIATVGPDAAPGGTAIAVTLVQADAILSGSGVMRPRGNGYLLAFELVDSAGDRYLFQVPVRSDSGGFSGEGLWLSEADETSAGLWNIGTPPGTGPLIALGSIATTFPNSAGCPAPACAPPPGPQLPFFTGDQLLGGGSRPAPATPLDVVEPPTLGRAGQPLGLFAFISASCCGYTLAGTYRWSFGDGATSEPSSRQTVTHTWAAPGVYTVAAVVTDETGVSTFALTQIRIAAASS